MGEFIWTYQPAKNSPVSASKKPPKSTKGKFKTKLPRSRDAVLNQLKRMSKKYK